MAKWCGDENAFGKLRLAGDGCPRLAVGACRASSDSSTLSTYSHAKEEGKTVGGLQPQRG